MCAAANPSLVPLQVAPIAAQVVAPGGSLSLRPHVTDLNFPSGRITFSLDPGAPVGAQIDPQSGVFTYTPRPGDGVSSVTIRATAYGLSSLSAATTFSVTPAGSSSPTISLGPAVPVAAGTEFDDTGTVAGAASGAISATVDYGDEAAGPQALAVRLPVGGVRPWRIPTPSPARTR